MVLVFHNVFNHSCTVFCRKLGNKPLKYALYINCYLIYLIFGYFVYIIIGPIIFIKNLIRRVSF